MRKKGFTLIELLVVISIIGILIIFLAPKLFNFKDKGNEIAVKAVMHSVQLAVESYNMENQYYPIAKNIPVKSLCENYLMVGNYISSVPKNPYTGEEYTDADTSGKVIYDHDEETGKYNITGYKRGGDKVLLELSNM